VEPDPKSPGWLKQERRLIKRARRGDREAFAALYRAYARPLYARVLMPNLGDPGAAEDALADTFSTALERLAQYEIKDVSIWNWLARIAKNKAIDMHRGRARTARTLCSFKNLFEPLTQGVKEPEHLVEARDELEQTHRQVQAILEKLNPRYQEAIRLRFLEDKSRPECAELLDVKIGTLDVLVLRALRAFRRQWMAMNEEGGQDE
jgi:RNA polymerase sigma factor (sigma-70 family)